MKVEVEPLLMRIIGYSIERLTKNGVRHMVVNVLALEACSRNLSIMCVIYFYVPQGSLFKG